MALLKKVSIFISDSEGAFVEIRIASNGRATRQYPINCPSDFKSKDVIFASIKPTAFCFSRNPTTSGRMRYLSQ